jgi:hypothetical protein
MPEYARMVTFDATDEALDALLAEINSTGGPPEGIPATRIIVLANRAEGRVAIAVRFASQEDMKEGGATLESMSPPEGMTRVSVQEYEVMLERQAP